MAKHHDDPPSPPAPAAPAHAEPKKAEGKGTHVVTFAGLPGVTVTAISEEKAIEKAAAEMGVNLPTERPPDVQKL